MKRVSTIYFFCTTFIIISLSTQANLFGALQFVSRNSNLVVNPESDSCVGLRKVSQITGFSQDSIINIYGNTQPDSWTETYTAGVQIGYGRQHEPSTMVYNNSNAVNYLILPLIVQNSNVVNDLTRQVINDSSVLRAIIPLTRADSQLITYLPPLEKNNSNAIVAAYNNTTNITNMLLMRGNSQAIVTLSRLLYANSSVIVSSTALAKTTSSAIISLESLIRQDSNVISLPNSATTLLNKQTSNAINYLSQFVTLISNHVHYAANTTINNLNLYQAGFDIAAGQTLTLNTPLPVNGNISLNNTGILSLDNDLYLGSNAYLTKGGSISGNSHSLIMTDSLTLPPSSTWQITSNLIINGNGNTLAFGKQAQILLASNVSVTLKNMCIQSGLKSPTQPFIQCIDQTGKITFDNVVINAANDFYFNNGRLFLNNDVHFTGTSRFIYQSPATSYIQPQSLLTFDPGTTLYYSPRSTNKDLIQLSDKSSGIYLKGPNTTLLTTDTGMRLTKGRLWIDNKVTLSTIGGNITSLSMTPSIVITPILSASIRIQSIDWISTGSFIAVGIYPLGVSPVPQTHVYRVNETTTTLIDIAFDTGGPGIDFASQSVRWSPNGNYLAVYSGGGVNKVRIFSFNGTSLTFFAISPTLTANPNGVLEYIPEAITWSPNSNYIAAIFHGQLPATYGIKIINTSGSIIASTSTSSACNCVTWHPQGNLLAIQVGSDVMLYAFNGSSLTLLHTATDLPAGQIRSLNFDPSGQYLCATMDSARLLVVYRVLNDNQLVRVCTQTISSGTGVFREARWDPSGNYIALALDFATTTPPFLQIYRFDGAALTLVSAVPSFPTIAESLCVTWSPNGKNVVLGGRTTSAGVPGGIIFPLTLTDTTTTTQALTNGLSFGNATLGSTYDLDVFLLADARAELNGKLFYNNVN